MKKAKAQTMFAAQNRGGHFYLVSDRANDIRETLDKDFAGNRKAWKSLGVCIVKVIVRPAPKARKK